MRHFKSACLITTITAVISMANARSVSAQFPTAGWLNRSTGGRITTPKPIQNMTPFQIRPAPTSTLSGDQNRNTWGQPQFRPTTKQPRLNPKANLTLNAGTQRKSLYSIKNNGQVYRGSEQVGRAHQTSKGWIAIGPGASFIQKDNGSTRTKVRSVGSYFK